MWVLAQAAAICIIVLTVVGVPVRFQIAPDKIRYEGGHLYSVKLPGIFRVFPIPTDGPEGQGSTLELSDGDLDLGPAHAVHEDIRTLGSGRYSHWGRSILFAPRDNSDPRINGVAYRFSARAYPHALLLVAAVGVLLLALKNSRASTRLGRAMRAVSYPARLGIAVVVHVAALSLLSAGAIAVYALYHPNVVMPGKGGDHSVIEQLAFFGQAADRYDLVFIGDSRTYTDIHPELIDPLLGTHSINLAQFANWLPTQYPMVRDLVDVLKPGTTVVWSIGHKNFYPSTGIQRVYPIIPLVAARYLMWDVPPAGLWDNLLYFTPGFRVLAVRGELRQNLYSWLQTPTAQALSRPPPAAPPPAIADRAAAARSELANLAPAASVTENWDGGDLVSLTGLMPGGGYYRIELDHDYFRRKQAAMNYTPIDDTAARGEAIPEPDRGLMRLFCEILEAFRQAHVRLIVNELEEAPFVYHNPILRQKWRAFMAEIIQPKVEALGFVYVRGGLDEIDDSDYFDWDHFNSKGINKYIPNLALRIRPYIAGSR